MFVGLAFATGTLEVAADAMELVAAVEAMFETKSPVRSRYFVGVATHPLNIVKHGNQECINDDQEGDSWDIRIADSSRIDAFIRCGRDVRCLGGARKRM
jgi:hypothetical protein